LAAARLHAGRLSASMAFMWALQWRRWSLGSSTVGSSDTRLSGKVLLLWKNTRGRVRRLRPGFLGGSPGGPLSPALSLSFSPFSADSWLFAWSEPAALRCQGLFCWMHLWCWEVAGAGTINSPPQKPRCTELWFCPSARRWLQARRRPAETEPGLRWPCPRAPAWGLRPAPRQSGQECRLLGRTCPGLLGKGCGGSLIYYFLF